MKRRGIVIIALCLVAVAVCFLANSQKVAEKTEAYRWTDKELMSKESFLQYIETNDTDCTAEDFKDIDIDDFIQKLNLTSDFLKFFMERHDMSDLIDSYEYALIYPNHILFTKDELFELLAIQDAGLTEEDFEGIDVDHLIEYYHIINDPERYQPEVIKSILESYKDRLKNQNAENYMYLFTTETNKLTEEDIPNIKRFYFSFFVGPRFGQGYDVSYLFDFEKNSYLFMPIDYSFDGIGIFAVDMNDLPRDAFERFCGLIVENNIVKTKQKNLPVPDEFHIGKTWNLCIELNDGRIIRYS